MARYLILLTVFMMLLGSPAWATTLLPTPAVEVWWTGSGGPGCDEYPVGAIAHYKLLRSPTGVDTWTVVADSLPHAGVGLEHAVRDNLPDLNGYDYRVLSVVDLAGQTFTAQCDIIDVKVFVICPGECGARTPSGP